MTGGGSLTYTVVLQRKRIGWKASCINRAVPVARQQTIWGAWPIQCRATPSTHTPSAGDTNASARTDTDTSWHSLMLSDAMLQLTIFPNAINNRSLSFSLYRVWYRVLSKKMKKKKKKPYRRGLETASLGRLRMRRSVFARDTKRTQEADLAWLPQRRHLILWVCVCFFAVSFFRIPYFLFFFF